MKRKQPLILLATLLCLALPAHTLAADNKDVEKRYVQSMDTLITLTAYGPHKAEALDKAEKTIHQLDELLSTGLPDSEITQLNAEGGGQVSEETSAIIEKALRLHEDTGGLFDITIYPLMQLWGFATTVDAAVAKDPIAMLLTEEEHHYHVPTEEELSSALEKIGSDRLTFKDGVLTMEPGQAIDLGGIAKGYASSKIMEVYKEAGCTSGMVSLGGNVQCLGTKPDGSLYVIAIRNPFGNESEYAATLRIEDEAIITSGGYERYFTDPQTGRTYQHIMDPRTGYPAESDLASVTILTKDGMLGDGLSTSLYIMGLTDSISYWRNHFNLEDHSPFEMILIGNDGTLYVSEGIKDQILSPADFEVITRTP